MFLVCDSSPAKKLEGISIPGWEVVLASCPLPFYPLPDSAAFLFLDLLNPRLSRRPL